MPAARRHVARLADALLPARKLRRVDATGLEHRGARATELDREGDRERLRLLCLAPERLLVLDEHRDRLVGLRARGGHRLRGLVVDLHLDLAAAVAVEIAGLQDEVAARAPRRM